MIKTNIGIVSLIVLMACFFMPTKASALSLRCPTNEYGIEECAKNPYENELGQYENVLDQFEGYPPSQSNIKISEPASDYDPLILTALVSLGILIGTLLYRRRKITSL